MYLLVDSRDPVLIDVIVLQQIFFRKSSIYILLKLGVSINKIQYILLPLDPNEMIGSVNLMISLLLIDTIALKSK
jgi:hypothetical protein